MSDGENTLIAHLEALRGTLLRILVVTALLCPVAYWAAPYAIDGLTRWCFPQGASLHYFAPMEVFWVQLKLALVLALAAAYPWNILQVWKFVLPALYPAERRALGWWVMFSSLLFFAGGAFCVGAILPLLMKFSASFATGNLTPLIGLESFLDLAGWLTLAFALMFQTPIVVFLAVRLGLVSAAALAKKRPLVVTVLLIVAALLTPPDVVSQLLLAAPTWLLFELGLLLARRAEKLRAVK
ncbi:MAG: twin-arginine translocase subunit TatC [Lentisphaeria bacterium]|nr:twin-arginine translocase subunit TatC [Lentisphaeria bacterium]